MAAPPYHPGFDTPPGTEQLRLPPAMAISRSICDELLKRGQRAYPRPTFGVLLGSNNVVDGLLEVMGPGEGDEGEREQSRVLWMYVQTYVSELPDEVAGWQKFGWTLKWKQPPAVVGIYATGTSFLASVNKDEEKSLGYVLYRCPGLIGLSLSLHQSEQPRLLAVRYNPAFDQGGRAPLFEDVLEIVVRDGPGEVDLPLPRR